MTALECPSRHQSSSCSTLNLLSPKAAPILSFPSSGIPALCSRQTTAVKCGSFSLTLFLWSVTEFGSFYLSSETTSLHLHGHPHVSSLALHFLGGLWPVPLHIPSRDEHKIQFDLYHFLFKTIQTSYCPWVTCPSCEHGW